MRTLIVGCGYIGLPLGAELVQDGHEVVGFGRSIESREEVRNAGILPINVDITDPNSFPEFSVPFDWVVHCVSSSHGGPDDYRNVYLKGTHNLIEWLGRNPPQKFLYTSSTGVYGQDDGQLVNEDAPTNPTTETGRILVKTEEMILNPDNADFPGMVLRVGGIYGPNRTYQLRRFLSGESRVEAGGRRHLNMIHRDDVVGAIIAALSNGQPGAIYHAVDDEPVPQIQFLQWLAETLAMELPPEAKPDELVARKRGITDKRVSNLRLKNELGYRFKFPTFREGYLTEIQRVKG